MADLLQELVFYINTVSDGDLSKLYSSGFPVVSQKRKGQAPDTPSGPYLCDGRRSGEIGFGFGPVGRDMRYEYCFATKVDEAGQPVWEEIHYTTRSFRAYIAGFVPGQYVYFRVRACNGHGESNWTSPIMWMVR